MTTWTTVAAVKAELVDRLRAVPALSGYVLDGVPWRDEDVMGPTGDGVSVWLDNQADITVEQLALGVGRIRESWVCIVVVQVVGLDSGFDVRSAEAARDELVSAVRSVIYDSSHVLSIDVAGWTVRLEDVAATAESGPMEHGGYSCRATIGFQVNSDRC